MPLIYINRCNKKPMRAGDKILNYNVTRRLKAGGMGVVFEGEQTWGSRRKVAIKQLLESLRDDEIVRRRFIREAEILELLDHSYIVKILGFDQEQDAFVMEYVEGQTLTDTLRENPGFFQDPAKLVSFFGKLLDAFSYAHHAEISFNGKIEKGIVHRDIKPSNIIVQPDTNPKILDFGISRVSTFQGTLTDPKLQMGSIPYMSPEQISTPTDVDWRSDIYSLGVTLWEILVGNSPYPRVTTHEVVIEVQRQIRFEPLPSIEEAVGYNLSLEHTFLQRVEQIIKKATAKNRNVRYQSCFEMKVDLDQALSNLLNNPLVDTDTLVKYPANQIITTPSNTVPPGAANNYIDQSSSSDNKDNIPPAVDKANIPEHRRYQPYFYGAIGFFILLVAGLWWSNLRQDLESPPLSLSDSTTMTESDMATILLADSCHEAGNLEYASRNYSYAADLYKKAAEIGNSDSQNMLGSMYQNGQDLPKDLDMALKWFKSSAEQGNAEGQKNLGHMYYFGLAVSQNYKEALKLYKSSAEQGNAESQASLGLLYEKGLGVDTDTKEAFKWYSLAANQNYRLAQYYIGTMYETGKGIPKDVAKAVQWYQLAAGHGEINAQRELRRLQLQ